MPLETPVVGESQEGRPRKRLKKSNRNVSARTHKEAAVDRSAHLHLAERDRPQADAHKSNDDMAAMQYRIMRAQALKIHGIPLVPIVQSPSTMNSSASSGHSPSAVPTVTGPPEVSSSGSHPQLESPLSHVSRKNPRKRTGVELEDPDTKPRSARPVKIFGLAEFQSDVSERSAVPSPLRPPPNHRNRMDWRKDKPRVMFEGNKSGRAVSESQGGLLAAELGVANSSSWAKSRQSRVSTRDTDKTNVASYPSSKRGQSIFNLPADNELLPSKPVSKSSLTGPSMGSPRAKTQAAEGSVSASKDVLPQPQVNMTTNSATRSSGEGNIQYGTEEDTSDTEEIPLQKPPPNMVLLTYGPAPPVVTSQPGFVVKTHSPQLGLPSPEETPRATEEPLSSDNQRQNEILNMPLMSSVPDSTSDTKESTGRNVSCGDNGQPNSDVDRAEPTSRSLWRVPLDLATGISATFFRRLLHADVGSDEYKAVARNLKNIFRFLLERARFTGAISDTEYENSVEEEPLADDPSGFLTRHMLAYTNNGRFLRYESWKKNGRERFRGVPVLSKYRTTWDDVRTLHKSVAKKLQDKDPAYKVVDGYVELPAEAFTKNGALLDSTESEEPSTPESGDNSSFKEERLAAAIQKDQYGSASLEPYSPTSPESTDDQTNSQGITVNMDGTVSIGMGDYLRIRKAKDDGSARSRLQIQQLESSFRWTGERGRVTLENQEADEVRKSVRRRDLDPKISPQLTTPKSFASHVGAQDYICLDAFSAANDTPASNTGSKKSIAPEVVVISDDEDEQIPAEPILMQQPLNQQPATTKPSPKRYVYKRKRPPGTKVTSADLLRESTLDDLRAAWGLSGTRSVDETSIDSQINLLKREREEVEGALASITEESRKTNNIFQSGLNECTSSPLVTPEDADHMHQLARRIVLARNSHDRAVSMRKIELTNRLTKMDGELEALKAQRVDNTEASRPDDGRLLATAKASDTLQTRLDETMRIDTAAVRMARSVFEWASTQEENFVPEAPKKRKKPLRKRKNW